MQMNKERGCPFTFTINTSDKCRHEFCQLWIDDGEDSACALMYEPLLLAKKRARDAEKITKASKFILDNWY